MPISVANFPLLSFEQANPILMGMSAGQNLISTYLKNQLQRANNKYAEPMAAAQLAYNQELPGHVRAQTALQNEQARYFGPSALSNIASQRAQAALQGEQTKYYGADKRSEMALRQSQIAAAELKKHFPLLGEAGVAGQIGAQQYLQYLQGQQGNQQQPSQTMHPSQQEQPSSLVGRGVSSEMFSPQMSQSLGLPQAPPMQAPSLQSQMAQNAQAMPAAPMGQESAGDLASILQNSIQSALKNQNARGEYLEARTKALPFTLMTPTAKNHEISVGKALGYTYGEATDLLTQGKSLRDLAVAKGEDPNNLPLPEEAATTATLTAYQKSKVGLAGLNAIDTDITEAMAPYSKRFKGWSPKQIGQSILGLNEDAQGDYLGARAMQLELAAMRARGGGALAGVTLLQEIVENSQGEIKNMGINVSEKVFRRMNEFINKNINKMNEAERRATSQYIKEYSKRAEEKNETSTHSDDAIIAAALGGD